MSGDTTPKRHPCHQVPAERKARREALTLTFCGGLSLQPMRAPPVGHGVTATLRSHSLFYLVVDSPDEIRTSRGPACCDGLNCWGGGGLLAEQAHQPSDSDLSQSDSSQFD